MSWNPMPIEELWILLSQSDSPSLLKKFLTLELYNKLKDKKTLRGGTLANCINTGCLHFRNNAGIYACDPEAYTVFEEIFNKVIKEYHKIESLCHPEPYYGTEEEIAALGNIDPEGKMVISTRVRVARSHTKYPFIPACTLEDLLNMENDTVTALKTLTGELAGQYYPLARMDKATEAQLVADHYLFRHDDITLRDAGLYKYWDTGRGIFYNEDQTFLCWVNEEDHIRLISLQKGGDLAAVYKRLVKAIHEMEDRMTFARRDGYGYLTFCATNLGTTLRASVLMAIPNVSKQANFDDFLAKHNIQSRGTRGFGSAVEDGVHDLSNKHRLGLTEYEAVKEMLNGVLAIKKWEEELAGMKKNA
ncbi:arginine kinase-like [Mercenaria mercenaria]|uniref:arginine kinase-like n=1 Tax=Mercenaria mercenaria TaxID=6596 RepID=UPI00234FB3C9|nr:arginine kinase-like [Mercenaria mercenaria]